ncbi:LysE family translocator [Macromonas nakdongensis]|uniref:LysE family translocator n=1 Tax=Macromonas nakdongensis TaxID=1843082 RepID=UPI000C33D062|nr:LysE family translocator [Macromonas nakdongensis]
MPDTPHLLVFIAAGWLLNLAPGPDVLYIVTHALRGGWRAGMVAGLGITGGCFVHVFAAALGMGALLAASATAFTVLKWLGAAYLLWTGVRMLVARAPTASNDLRALASGLPSTGLHKVFWGGFLTNVLNPKVALFFLAFLPQFIAPDVADKTQAFLLLGLLFNLNSIPVSAGWALLAAWMARHDFVQRGMHGLDKVAGVMFVLFGLRLALTERPGP